MLVDTHTHLESFARRGVVDDILRRSADAGVRELITIGTSSDDWALYRDLAHRFTSDRVRIHYTAGLHPCSVDETWPAQLTALPDYWSPADPTQLRPVALGEMGLDRFHLPKDPGEAARIFGWQKAAFAQGLTLARELNVPVVIHSRGAFAECVEMIDASGISWERVVFHCFTEGPAEMNELLRRGARGSLTGIVTYKSAEALRDAARLQGLDRLLLETDAPYLTPVPHRGKPNEPAYLRHTAEFVADLLGVSLETLATRTTQNARAFFGLTA